mgnify:FL=1
MFEEFYDRINLKSELSDLSKIICEKYKFGPYISEKLILVGYEDFNFILSTSIDKNYIIVFLYVYKFIILSIISLSSILLIPKHFLPKSLIEAPK